MSTHTGLDSATEVTLLLCNHVGGVKSSKYEQLNSVDFNFVRSLMDELELSFDDLLTPAGVEKLCGHSRMRPKLEPRIRALLQPERRDQIAGDIANLHELGIWVISRDDAVYPERLREKLKNLTPPLLYGVGPQERLVDLPRTMAIIGAHGTEKPGRRFARLLGGAAAAQREAIIVSGGSRGADRSSIRGALANGGTGVFVVPSILDRRSAYHKFGDEVSSGDLTIISPYHPQAPFLSSHTAGRTKVIHGLADVVVVVNCEDRIGETWEGALDNIRRGWSPVYVRIGDETPIGNKYLLKRKAQQIDHDLVDDPDALTAWLTDVFPDEASGIESDGLAAVEATQDDESASDLTESEEGTSDVL